MAPTEFVTEYWKFYAAYRESKEHLIEVTATLYLAFVSALLLRDTAFWCERRNMMFTLALWFITTLFVYAYVARQFRYRNSAARLCNACQTLMAQWLVKAPGPAVLEPEDDQEFPSVKVPKALADELERRRERWRNLSRCQRLCDAPFEIVVYGLAGLWAVALIVRVWGAYH